MPVFSLALVVLFGFNLLLSQSYVKTKKYQSDHFGGFDLSRGRHVKLLSHLYHTCFRNMSSGKIPSLYELWETHILPFVKGWCGDLLFQQNNPTQ